MNGLDASGGCHTANGCYVDALTVVFNGCSANCPKLRRDASTGLYNYDAADPETLFERRIYLENVAGTSDEKKIRVVLTWQERLVTHSFTLERHIFLKL